MDNCIIHHNAGALQILVNAGIRVEFLPPYSPDMNPVLAETRRTADRPV